MSVSALDHVVIAVSDWEWSNAFYRDVLGVELVQTDKGRWAYAIGGIPAERARPRVDARPSRAGSRPAGEQ